jgi:membrane protein implicated in regulation of membrane protease activity
MATTTNESQRQASAFWPGVISIFSVLIAVIPIVIADRIKTPLQGFLLVLTALAVAALLRRILVLWRGGLDIQLLVFTIASCVFSAIFALQTFGLPKPGKEALLSVVPDQLKGTCQENVEEFFKDTLASVKCSSGDSRVPEIRLGLFEDAGPFYEAYSGSVRGRRVAVNSGSENCAKGKPGEASWEYEELGSPGGRVLCYRDENDDAWIEWTYDAQRIYAFAYRQDSDIAALYKWWQSI